MSPLLADIVAKVENRATRKISRKLIFGLLRRCDAFQRHYGGPWSILDETIWSLTSPLVKRISGSKKFRSSPQKDFCNNIGTKRTSANVRLNVRFRGVKQTSRRKVATSGFDPIRTLGSLVLAELFVPRSANVRSFGWASDRVVLFRAALPDGTCRRLRSRRIRSEECRRRASHSQ